MSLNLATQTAQNRKIDLVRGKSTVANRFLQKAHLASVSYLTFSGCASGLRLTCGVIWPAQTRFWRHLPNHPVFRCVENYLELTEESDDFLESRALTQFD